ncbi:MAG: hypothetical protein ACRDZQ_16525, partial [Acidimicrobiales bacterium]
MNEGLVGGYVELGLRLGRHIDGLVDAYYGPAPLARRVLAEPPVSPERLAAEARGLLGRLEAGEPLDSVGSLEGSVETSSTPTHPESPQRRAWLHSQLVGLLTTAASLAGTRLSYADEVEACYG